MENLINLESLNSFKPLAGLRAKLVHTDNQTIAFWEIDEGTILPDHSHMHEQITVVTAGELELTVAGETAIVKPGMTVVIPAHAIHSARALTHCSVTDVFYPVREDFK